MAVEFIALLAVELLYALACLRYGTSPGAPAWLSWPDRAWSGLKTYIPRTTPHLAPRPDYAKIRRLEHELGLVADRPIRNDKVCLVKGCDEADITDVRSWSGMLLARIHEH